MDGEVAADPTGKISGVHQQALLSNVTAAIRNGDTTMQKSAIRRAKAARDADPEGWGEEGKGAGLPDCRLATLRLQYIQSQRFRRRDPKLPIQHEGPWLKIPLPLPQPCPAPSSFNSTPLINTSPPLPAWIPTL